MNFFQVDEHLNEFWKSVFQVLTKTIFPALVAVSVGLAVKMQKSKITWFSATCSFVTGVGLSFICGQYIHENYSQGTATILIGIIAISSDKIVSTIMDRLEMQDIGKKIIDIVKRML